VPLNQLKATRKSAAFGFGDSRAEAQRSEAQSGISNTPWFTVKTIPCLGGPTPASGMEVKQGESVIWLFLKINLSTSISTKRSRRELSIDIVVHRGAFKNNQITLFSCFTLIPETGVGFYCAACR